MVRELTGRSVLTQPKGNTAMFTVDPAPGSGVSEIFQAGQTEMSASVPLILTGLAAILGLGWVIRSAFIAQRVAKKASNQVG